VLNRLSAFGLVLILLSTALGQGDSPKSLEPQDVIQFLNKNISWYQHLAVQRQMELTPGDILFADDDRSIAEQAVRLSFDFARASSQLLENNQGSLPPSPSADPRYQSLSKSAAKLDDQIKQARTDLDALRQKLDGASPRQQKALESGISEAQSELALLQARRDAVRSLMQFLGGAAEPGGLGPQIDALEKSVPTAFNNDAAQRAGSNSDVSAVLAAASSRSLEPSGIWETLRALFRVSGKLRTIDENVNQTNQLLDTVKQLQNPLRDRLKSMVRQSDAIVQQPDSQDPAVLAQQKSTLDGLTVQFKGLASALLPLSKEAILLNSYQRNLGNWRAAVKSDYTAYAKSLLVQLLGLGVVLGVVLGMFELWRRAIYRYIVDSRRRYQFLLLRRIALWFAIAIIIAFGFASELGSVATFAGLLTAGVAVALQNVIVAIVGYFLLIGKFGVRVGDRVQISGVSGEVVEIGMIRLHVMELSGAGADAQPTGRIVAFSNSIVFQPTAGLFKQVPGASFMWHEISITLAPDSDYQEVEKRMLAAVDSAFKDYQKDFENLRQQVERNLSSISVGSLAPKVRFKLTQAGLEVVVRFPVEAQKAGDVDDRVTRHLLQAIEQEPKLKVVGADVPTIRLRTDTHAAEASPA
jgi:small-conductance mechanosensitive channel